MKTVLRVSAAGLVSASLLSGCVSTPRVAVEQMGDESLTCEQLQAEYQKLDALDRKADDNKSVNTQNVVAAVFFWPAVVSTVMSADAAQKSAAERRTRLVQLAHDKGCAAKQQ